MHTIPSITAAAHEADCVRQVPVPPDARALATLAAIDYEDGFLVEIEQAGARTPEQWARAILEDAPVARRSALLSGWSALGLKLGTTEPARRVLGWPIRRSTPEFVLLGADSRVGMPAELLFVPQRDGLFFATFVQHNQLSRIAWAPVVPVHLLTVRSLLEEARRRVVQQSDQGE